MWILAIDGGGSKTLARLMNTNTGQHWQLQGGPASLTNDFTLAIVNIRHLISELCLQSGAETKTITCVMGLAGAGNPQQQSQACAELRPLFAKLLITTDARTSLYGANIGQPVVVVALGTGSVAMRLQANGKEQQVGGWGFNIGDEGGGAWLGKLAVRELLWQVDSSEGISSPLLRAIAAKVGKDADTLLPWLKAASPTDFAALAPLVFQYKQQCVVADRLLQQQASAVTQLIERSREQSNLPVVLLGGLATLCSGLLSEAQQALLQPARGSALDGAFILAAQLNTTQHLAGTCHD